MNSKITETHLSKPAYIYLRQSTPGQVRHHQQSTERQYGLRGKALQLGWTEASVRVLDRDLGLSGAHSAAREDFKTLVAEVSMGQVGAVFALEVSRLARSNADWHLELTRFRGLFKLHNWRVRHGQVKTEVRRSLYAGVPPTDGGTGARWSQSERAAA